MKIKIYAGSLGLIKEESLNPGDIVTLHGIVYKYEEVLEKREEISAMAELYSHQIEIE